MIGALGGGQDQEEEEAKAKDDKGKEARERADGDARGGWTDMLGATAGACWEMLDAGRQRGAVGTHGGVGRGA